MLLLCVDHLLAVVDQLDHGLLAVDVFAGVHGVDRHLAVPVVGNRDDDGVHVFAREHLAVVARGEDLVSPDLPRLREPAFVNIGDRDHLGAGRDGLAARRRCLGCRCR